ncbi:MAG: hypothetical protein IJ800_05430 [Clostridia bacterium]|nr:hypothetical protein [Clostridia bacterium]
MKERLRDNVTFDYGVFLTELDYEITGDAFVFKFDCFRSQLFSASEKDNDDLFNGDVAEVFIRTGKDQNEYFEIEVAPNGKKFFAKIKLDGEDIGVNFLDPSMIDAEVYPYKSGYKAIIRIPFVSVEHKSGEEVYFNAFRIETEGGIPEKNLLALYPTTTGKFHDPSAFHKLKA